MRKIIFAHQGKTGGASLVKSFHKTFGSEFVCRDIDNRKRREKLIWNRILDKRLENYRRYRDRSSYKVIHGHFSPKKYRKAFPDALFITFFRDPIQKLISLYYYWKRTPALENSAPNHARLLKENYTLVEFAEIMSNSKNIDKGISLYNVQNFDFIGITEAYSSSIELLSNKHLQGVTLKAIKGNVNPEKKMGESYKLDEDLYKYFCELNNASLDLYSEAVEVFRADCKEHGIEARFSNLSNI